MFNRSRNRVQPTKEYLHEHFSYDGGFLWWKKVFSNKCSIGGRAGHMGSKYLVISIENRVFTAQRLIWIYHHGIIPPKMEIDHINELKTDNRIENLRLADGSSNKSNTTISKSNKSGHKGISWNKEKQKWETGLIYRGKKYKFGYFSDFGTAVEVYRRNSIKLLGEFSPYAKPLPAPPIQKTPQ